MLTMSGKKFNPNKLRSNTYCIEDIAHALSKEVRYGGHGRGSYTVAQHSVVCSEIVEPALALCALMHDATEAYIKDMPKPVKEALGASYRNLEQGVWIGIAKSFNLPTDLPVKVHEADMAMMAIEVRCNIAPHPTHSEWTRFAKYDTDKSVKIEGIWTQKAAEEAFLKRYNYLINQSA